MIKKRHIRQKLEVWKEMLPSISFSELHRLICRIKRHAKIISYNYDHGKVILVLGYRTLRDRISTRVLLSSWIGKNRYQSVRVSRLTPAKRRVLR